MVDPFLEQRLAVAAALNDPRLAAQKDAILVKADLDDCSVKQCKAFEELMIYLRAQSFSKTHPPTALRTSSGLWYSSEAQPATERQGD